jgi:hypothetical protein
VSEGFDVVVACHRTDFLYRFQFVQTEAFCGSGKQNVSIPLHALSGSIQSTLHVVSGITNTLHSALLDYLWVKLILQEIHQRGSSLHCLL